LCVILYEHQLAQKFSALGEIGGTYHKQKFSYLLLKNHDKREHPHTYKLPKNAAQQLHFKKFCELANKVYDHDPDKNVYRHCPLYQLIEIVKQ
jgi:ribosomal protein L33